MLRKKQIESLKRDIAKMVDEFRSLKDKNEFLRPNVLVDVWRCMTKMRLLSRLEQTPAGSAVIAVAKLLDMPPDRLVDLANIGEWIQVDRDTREWADQDEYDEYWSCHYDEGGTVRSYESLRTSIQEIQELDNLWMT